MTVKFHKYQGTGNDFILIDNRSYGLSRDMKDKFAALCHRRFGIGADGIILLQEVAGYDFEMVYFNSDGGESTMCGNGGRCIVRFAYDIGAAGSKCTFLAIDGPHEGEIHNDGTVSLLMKNVEYIEQLTDSFILNTGSPHFVCFTNEVGKMDIVKHARQIRYNDRFSAEGINVNFAEKISANEIFVRTYERGVEDETYSCGTGVVASSIALAHRSGIAVGEVKIQTPGGPLSVSFSSSGGTYSSIYLKGGAEAVFTGEVKL